MTLSRRRFLQMGGLAGAVSMAGCAPIGRHLADNAGSEDFYVPLDDETLLIRRLMNRAGYGPRPGDLEAAREIGFIAYLETQLSPERIDDTPADLMIRHLSLYGMDGGQLLHHDHRDIAEELIRATLIRAIYSRRQLYEAMVEFWSDHFNIYIQLDHRIARFKLLDDRDTIRPHALGTFPDLLRASARSPAMLYYLDNDENYAERPNENYAREIMELHTLGIDGGYTQSDVEALARILTGWGVHQEGANEGEFAFFPDHHDTGDKVLLGQYIPAGHSEAEILSVLEQLSLHPSTARLVATKLVRRFVANPPPEAMTTRIADTYLKTGGDIKTMLSDIFLSEEFRTAAPKFKRPYTYLIAAVRALGADIGWGGYRALDKWLLAMGQLPFHWPMPDGYPDEERPWLNSLLPRWNFAVALATGEIDGVRIPYNRLPSDPAALAGLLLEPASAANVFAQAGIDPDTEALSVITALLLTSPGFQWA